MSDILERPAVVDRHDPWKMSSVTIRRVQHESSGVFTIEAEFDDPSFGKKFQFAPGQFNMLYAPGVGEAAISIAGSTEQGWLQHTIRAVGSVTRELESGGVGMQLGLRGPFGRPWPLDWISAHHDAADLVIVAGGIGLAPLRVLIERIAASRNRFGEVHVLLGARSPADLLYCQLHSGWLEQQLAVDVTVDRGPPDWKGHTGVVTLLLERLDLPRPKTTFVMTCGPEVMMRYVAKSAIGRGIPESNIWVTLERNMNCAIGLCGHCQLGPKFICREGPVFRFDEVASWLRVQEY
ncbi:MAG: FAD/NAD(P)-binding protein [Planctomycetales bacterium]|nr:FAD/NAD(P)-binding protein [Planctomycetales bacterium]